MTKARIQPFWRAKILLWDISIEMVCFLDQLPIEITLCDYIITTFV